MSASISSFCAVVMLVGILASLSPAAAVGPTAWPPRHTHIEIEWDLQGISNAQGPAQRKLFLYDFNSLSLKVEMTPVDPLLAPLYGFQSYWIGDTLSMVINVAGIVFCQQIPFGFGMPVPNWMLTNSTPMGELWLTRVFNPGFDLQKYYPTQWTRKDGAGVGWFDYFSLNTTGAPFRMTAPSPTQGGTVVNEYYDFEPVEAFPPGTFNLPPQCKNATSAPIRVMANGKVSETLRQVDNAVDRFVSQVKGLSAAEVLRLKQHYSGLVLRALV